MSYEKLIIDVCIDAPCITGALKGLRAFATDRFTSLDDISCDDLSMLNGMIAALVALAEKHETQMYQLENDC